MDHVFIEGLEIEALIGIYDWERRIRQPLVFDIEMAFDNRVPAATGRHRRHAELQGDQQRASSSTFPESRLRAGGNAGRGASRGSSSASSAVQHVRLKLSKPGAVRGARAWA